MASVVDELTESLYEGVKEGRNDSISEAPYIEGTLGFKPDYNALKNMPIEVGPLPKGVLGVTHVSHDGKAVGMRVSQYITDVGLYLKDRYNKSWEWTKDFVRRLARDTTNHEDYHIMSAYLAKGEKLDGDARNIMESVTTRGRYKVAEALGKREKAEWVKKTNPYPSAWKLAEVADWAPYESESGRGYKAFLADASRERFYKPMWRLGKSAAKAAWSRGKEYVSGRMPAAAYAA